MVSNLDDESLQWMRSRPDSVKQLMRRFPPACLVRFTEAAAICADHADEKDEVLMVVSYSEDDTIGVAKSYAKADRRVHVAPEHVEIVGFSNGQDREWVAGILD